MIIEYLMQKIFYYKNITKYRNISNEYLSLAYYIALSYNIQMINFNAQCNYMKRHFIEGKKKWLEWGRGEGISLHY